MYPIGEYVAVVFRNHFVNMTAIVVVVSSQCNMYHLCISETLPIYIISLGGHGEGKTVVGPRKGPQTYCFASTKGKVGGRAICNYYQRGRTNIKP